MIRDPFGPQYGNWPTNKFNVTDTDSWTEDYKLQVPGGIDPTDYDFYNKTGVFFMEERDVY